VIRAAIVLSDIENLLLFVNFWLKPKSAIRHLGFIRRKLPCPLNERPFVAIDRLMSTIPEARHPDAGVNLIDLYKPRIARRESLS
jgi:hypothetical protein